MNAPGAAGRATSTAAGCSRSCTARLHCLSRMSERKRIAGMVINKFRGDVELTAPGPQNDRGQDEILPVLGVVPYMNVEIEDEDSLSDRLNAKSAVKPLDVAVIRLPHISNFTDFMPLEQHELLGVRYVQRARELKQPDMVILPGTKKTMEDLLWLRQSGLEAALLKLAQGRYTSIRRVRRLSDVRAGLGRFARYGERARHDACRNGAAADENHIRPPKAANAGAGRRIARSGPFAGAALEGYEIHNGQTRGGLAHRFA